MVTIQYSPSAQIYSRTISSEVANEAMTAETARNSGRSLMVISIDAYINKRESEREACIETSCDSGTSTFKTYYSNFIAR